MVVFIIFSLFCVCERAIFIGPPSNVLERVEHSPMEASLWMPSCKIETNLFPYSLHFQFKYMKVELWANHLGKKLRCYWEGLSEQLGNLEESHGNMSGTHWEQGRKTKKQISPHPQTLLIGPMGGGLTRNIGALIWCMHGSCPKPTFSLMR
jgi:hypothetical protein